MLFLLALLWLVAASFAYLLAILTPTWVTIPPTPLTAARTFNLGVFSSCEILSSNATQLTTRCTPFDQYANIDTTGFVKYGSSTRKERLGGDQIRDF